MSLLDKLHDHWVHGRRVKVLARLFDRVLPPATLSLLDVGCGDGRLACELRRLRPNLTIQGLDVFARPAAAIPVAVFDGRSLPFENENFDVVMFADVLHHTDDPVVLLREAARVSRLGVAIKDHLRQGVLAQTTLSFMDWIGNASHGVALTYNYWRPGQWQAAFKELGLKTTQWETKLGLYSFPASLFFERALHVVAFLESDFSNDAPAA
jgi:ubiquinone/menaquinone biosynthesis C-methylase UbiE